MTEDNFECYLIYYLNNYYCILRLNLLLQVQHLNLYKKVEWRKRESVKLNKIKTKRFIYLEEGKDAVEDRRSLVVLCCIVIN